MSIELSCGGSMFMHCCDKLSSSYTDAALVTILTFSNVDNIYVVSFVFLFGLRNESSQFWCVCGRLSPPYIKITYCRSSAFGYCSPDCRRTVSRSSFIGRYENFSGQTALPCVLSNQPSASPNNTDSIIAWPIHGSSSNI